MIAVDSSVWIDALRGVDTPQVAICRELIADDAPVAVPDVVLTEVLKGARDETHAAELDRAFAAFPVLRLEAVADFLAAARLYRVARAAGFTVGSNVDLLVAAVCVREDAPLLHSDADFDRLASCTPLRVFE